MILGLAKTPEDNRSQSSGTLGCSGAEKGNGKAMRLLIESATMGIAAGRLGFHLTMKIFCSTLAHSQIRRERNSGMLSKLRIKNLPWLPTLTSIFRQTQRDTGETGAGKSVIIGAPVWCWETGRAGLDSQWSG